MFENKDHGGANDSRCEFSFFTRCPDRALFSVTFGQQGGWTYAYCKKHADDAIARDDFISVSNYP